MARTRYHHDDGTVSGPLDLGPYSHVPSLSPMHSAPRFHQLAFLDPFVVEGVVL